MKFKTALLITRANLGGAQKHLISLLKTLKDHCDVLVLVGSKGYLTDQLDNLGVKYKIIPSMDSKLFWIAPWAVRRTLKTFKPDIINTHSTLASIYGRIGVMGLKIPVVYSVHGWFFANNATKFRKIIGPLVERQLSAMTAHWITETQYDLELGLDTGAIKSRETACVMPNGIPTPTRREVSLDKSKLNLIFVGRLSYQKDPELALRVMSLLPNHMHLHMYCDSTQNQSLQNLIRSLGIKDKVTLIDDEKNTSEIIHNFQILLCTSRYEGMPLSIIEAMASGIPVVSSNVCGLDELVEHQQTGILIDSRNPSDYANAIIKLADDPSLRQDMERNSISRFHERHHETVMGNDFLSILTRVKDAHSPITAT